MTSAVQHPNIQRFIAFRVFFGARFYYPVYMILFLDFGLTLEEFVILNAIWAGANVVLEVPSGALADIFGRKNLIVLAGFLMVLEFLIMCLVPLGNHSLVFWAFALNRFLSEAAEAAASGADEALAYDTINREGSSDEWPQVLERLMRYQSAAFFTAMIVGAAVYDPRLLNAVAGWVGLPGELTKEETFRLPLWLNLVTALCALAAALGMRNLPTEIQHESEPSSGSEAIEAFRVTFRAGRWILNTPLALIVILAGILFDHIVRHYVTLSSEYFRIILIPEALFGVAGASFALIGFAVAGAARKMAEDRSPHFNTWVLAALTFTGLAGTSLAIPYSGILFILALFSVWSFLGFFISHYLNQIVSSEQRATVLSFKGLAMNLGYGGIGILYTILVATLKTRHQGLSGEDLRQTVFVESLAYFPWYFLALFLALLIFGRLYLTSSADCCEKGGFS